MTMNLDQMLNNARRLVDRLREHDVAADSLVSKTQGLKSRIETMKEYQEDMEELNESVPRKSRAALILGIRQENRQMRELQQENRELKASLEENQVALELVMSRYREQVLKLILSNKRDQNHEQHQNNTKELQARAEKICEMATVMRQAVLADEDALMNEQELVTQLETENSGLREMLGISKQFRSRDFLLKQQQQLQALAPVPTHSTGSATDSQETAEAATDTGGGSPSDGSTDTLTLLSPTKEKSSEKAASPKLASKKITLSSHLPKMLNKKP